MSAPRAAVDARLLVPAVMAAGLISFLSASDPILALVGAFAAGVVVLTLTHPYALLLALVAATPWEGWLAYPTETVTLVKLLGLLLVVSYMFRLLATRERLTFPSTTIAVVLFVLLAGLSLIAGGDIQGGLEKWVRYLSFAGFFLIATQLVRDRAQVIPVLKVLVLSGAAAGAVGAVRFLAGTVDRARGPIADTNDFAFLLAVLLPIAAYLFIRERTGRPIWGACFMVLLTSTLATLSRGALVALAALGVWLILSGRIRWRALAAALAVVVGLVGITALAAPGLLTDRLEARERTTEDAARTREALWDAALDMSVDHPVLGVGTGRFETELPNYVRDAPSGVGNPGAEGSVKTAHGTYVEILAEGGIVTLAAFVAFLAGSWRLLSRSRTESARAGDMDGLLLASALQASLMVALIAGTFLSMQVNIAFWLLGALAAALAIKPVTAAVTPPAKLRGSSPVVSPG